MSNFVNHNQTQANVRIQWSSSERGNHMPDLLERDVSHLDEDKKAKLAMDMIALREIQPDEEIFLDYGDEWEAAWQEHVKNWEPVAGADDYLSAADLMNDHSLILPTVFDLIEHPRTVQSWCNTAFYGHWWKKDAENGKLQDILRRGTGFTRGISDFMECDIVRHRTDEAGNVLYTAVQQELGSHSKMVDVPRQAFRYTDTPLSTDMHLRNAFRHDIRIPDDVFPRAWRNNLVE
jgi:hypothetical protein